MEGSKIHDILSVITKGSPRESRNFNPTFNLFQSRLNLVNLFRYLNNQIVPLLIFIILFNLYLLFRKFLLNLKVGNFPITAIYRLNVGIQFIRLEPIINL